MITGSETTHLVSRQLPVVLEARLPTIPAPDVLALGLREDQTVRPLVTVQGDALKLALQGKVFDAPPGMKLVVGESPLMRVHLLPGGGALLRPVEEDAAPAPASVAPARLDRLLLMPGGFDTLLQALRPGVLQQWLAPALASNPQVVTLLQLLLRARPSMDALDGPGLRQAMLASGFLTETQLLQKSAAPADLKSVFRQLIEQLQTSHPESAAKLGEVVDEIEGLVRERGKVLAKQAAAESITDEEAQWLAERLLRDGKLSLGEQALVAALKAEHPKLHPAITAALDRMD